MASKANLEIMTLSERIELLGLHRNKETEGTEKEDFVFISRKEFQRSPAKRDGDRQKSALNGTGLARSV